MYQGLGLLGDFITTNEDNMLKDRCYVMVTVFAMGTAVICSYRVKLLIALTNFISILEIWSSSYTENNKQQETSPHPGGVPCTFLKREGLHLNLLIYNKCDKKNFSSKCQQPFIVPI